MRDSSAEHAQPTLQPERQPADQRGKQEKTAAKKSRSIHARSLAAFSARAALILRPFHPSIDARHPYAIDQMIALIQRVSEAAVHVDGECVGAIGPGLLALVAVEPNDDDARIRRMAERLLGYRVFADADGKMNLSVVDSGGALLLVSQFTLAADTRKGMRPSFTTAAAPELARQGFDQLVALCKNGLARVETGRFGAHMKVSLVNDGPVTFRLES